MVTLTLLLCLLIFSGAIVVLVVRSELQAKKYRWLGQYGMQVDATVTSIIASGDRRGSGEFALMRNTYYLIFAQWQHPETHQIYRFHSLALIELPEGHFLGSS